MIFKRLQANKGWLSTLLLLNCLFPFFIHIKLELLKQFPVSNDEKICWSIKIDISPIELFDELCIYHEQCYHCSGIWWCLKLAWKCITMNEIRVLAAQGSILNKHETKIHGNKGGFLFVPSYTQCLTYTRASSLLPKTSSGSCVKHQRSNVKVKPGLKSTSTLLSLFFLYYCITPMVSVLVPISLPAYARKHEALSRCCFDVGPVL